MPKQRKKLRKTARSSELSVPRLVGVRDTYVLDRELLFTTFQMVVGSPFFAALSMTPAAWPSNLLNFIAQFDLGMVDHVIVKFIPRWNVNTAAVVDDEIPQLITVPNFDDNTTPGAVDYVLGQGNSIMTRLTGPVIRRFCPGLLLPVGVTSGAMPLVSVSFRQWVNTSAFVTYPTLWPLCKLAITSTAGLPGSGKIDVYYKIRLHLKQHVTG